MEHVITAGPSKDHKQDDQATDELLDIDTEDGARGWIDKYRGKVNVLTRHIAEASQIIEREQGG